MLGAIAAMTTAATVAAVLEDQAVFEKSLEGLTDEEKADRRAKRGEQARLAHVARVRAEMSATKNNDCIGIWAFVVGLIFGSFGK